MMAEQLSRFEDHIQRLVEGGFARLFAGRLHPREVAVKLARALEDTLSEDDDGHHIARSVYTVRLNPQDHQAILQAEPELAENLADELLRLANAGGLSMHGQPDVRLLADDSVPPHDITVSARHRNDVDESSTQTMSSAALSKPIEEGPDAVLQIDKDRHVPLQDAVINIGRHRDNSIILDDPAVSRHHSQIRLRFGRYVLFDLGSAAGTKVNDAPIQEVVLESGDVIDIAGNRLIYFEEPTASESPQGDTQAYPPPDAT